MVVGKPYIHFTINNEPPEAEVDYTYTWATTVETTKGPINEPTLISSAAQAEAIFGVDMRPYFAQGAESLIMVRVVPDEPYNKPQKGIFSFITEEDIIVYRAEQASIKIPTEYSFVSYSDAQKTTEYGEGTVITTGITSEGYTEVEVLTNSVDGFVGNKYFISSSAKTNGTVYPLYEQPGANPVGIYVSVKLKGKKYVHKAYYTLLGEGEINTRTGVILIQERDANGRLLNNYIDDWNDDGTKTATATSYDATVVKPYFTPVKHIIRAGTSLFDITTKYDGDYGISISVTKSFVDPNDKLEGAYDILLTDPSLGSIKMTHVYDVGKIVNRINDAGLNFVATSTNAGLAITQVMNADSTYITEFGGTFSNSNKLENTPLIVSEIQEGIFVSTCDDNGTIRALTKDDVATIKAATLSEDEINLKKVNYKINLKEGMQQSLNGSSNGAWDDEEGRIPIEYRKEAHKAGLKLLRKLRIAGIFCMYEDNSIQEEYVNHGIDPREPEKGMNNNETCKWRTIILGSHHKERSSKSDLAARASVLNNQYILLLGQGLIDTGVNGIASKLDVYERQIQYGIKNEHQLLPCECTQYIAGLRSKLSYDESIFGGQGRKRIRSVGDLQIAPLFDYEDEYDWDPKTYSYLNESGVLTFTEEYGNITLTDGVTTCQKGFEEDEEGVMNILKYAQNSVYNVCLPYIGRNINGDLENAITMDIQSVLEEMKTGHGSIVDTDEYQAYTINVSLGSRANQLLGRIYIYLTITPAHALRQIEVEMTVQ